MYYMADIIGGGEIIRSNADNIEINSCGSIICVRFEGIISAFFPHAPFYARPDASAPL